jgi:hypothetical protein
MGISISGGTAGEQDQVENAVLEAINKAHDGITNPFLKKCVENHLLLDGSVIIEHGSRCEDDPTLLAWNQWTLGWFGYKRSAEKVVHLCIDHIRSNAQLVSVLVHEFAHSCCWDHGDGQGVPGDDGTIGAGG